MIRTLSRIVFFIGLLAVIALSVMPQENASDPETSVKFAHLAAYAVLALAGGIVYRGSRSILILVVGLVFLGLGLEIVQAFVPGRAASGYDVLSNTIGIALGSAAAITTNMVMKRRLRILG